jgi:hypothetical protein
MLGVARFKSLIVLLLALTFVGIGLAQSPAERIDAARSVAELNSLIQEDLETFGPPISRSDRTLAQEKADLKARIALRDRLAGRPATATVDAQAEAKRILSAPQYRTVPEGERNWLGESAGRVGERIGQAIGRFFEWLLNLLPRPNVEGLNGLNLGIFGQIIYILAWVLIGGALIAFVVFVARKFGWIPASIAGRKRAGGGLLEEDEPDRTADEWLLEASRLEREGKFREAVRCLYLACLIRLDEKGIAAFRRGETNWEHLRRIEGSRRRPADLDFRDPTSRFDWIWYGHRVNGPEDVAFFRALYTTILNLKPAEVAS